MSEKDPGVAVARLLEGLHDRGLAIGTDDARRIAAVFRHSAGWSHRRRIRALKALIARSDEERQIVDQLAPFLFVGAERVAEPIGATPAGGAAATATPLAEAVPPAVPEAEPGPGDSERKPPGGRGPQPLPRRLGWRAVVVGLAVAGVLAAGGISYWRSHSRISPSPPDQPASTPPPPNPTPDKESELRPCPFLDPPGQPGWPFGILVVVGLLPPLMTLWAMRVFRRQARNIEVLAASRGPRIYRLELPERYPINPINPGAVRDVAFQLSGPVAETAAPWLDVPQTVDETTRAGGQIVLRYDRWLEHRPIVFIEDIGPGMAAFPVHGPQLRAALTGQGAQVQTLFMDGTPDRLSTRSDMVGARPFDEVLDLRHEPILLIFSDARAIPLATLEQASWLPLLSRAIWLHPAPIELWQEGARTLSRHATVVPATEAGLERLSPHRSEGAGALPGRWRPAVAAGSGAEQRIRLWRAALGDATFFWLAGTAVLARLGQARASIVWALRAESVTGPVEQAPLERAHRVFALDGLAVTPDGSLLIPEAEREALIAALERERPEILARVVDWVDRLIERDLARLDPTSPSAIGARVMRARLWSIQPARRRKAAGEMARLVRAGYGSWVSATVGDSERAAWISIRFERLRNPGARGWVFAGLGVAFMLTGATLLARPAWRPTVKRVGPMYEVLTSSPIRFCDRYQLTSTFKGQLDTRSNTSGSPFRSQDLSLDAGLVGIDRGVWTVTVDTPADGQAYEYFLFADSHKLIGTINIARAVPSRHVIEPSVEISGEALGNGEVSVEATIIEAPTKSKEVTLYKGGTAVQTLPIPLPTSVGEGRRRVVFKDKVPRPGRYVYEVRTDGGASSKRMFEVPPFKAAKTPNPVDDPKVGREILARALKGDAWAQTRYGELLERGGFYGIARDPAQAIYWYEKAAAQHESSAIESLKRLRSPVASDAGVPEKPAARDAGSSQTAQRADPKNARYGFVLMYEADPRVEKPAARLRERLLAAGFRQMQFDRVKDRTSLYAYDRTAGHSYLDFHPTVPKDVRSRVLPLVREVLPDVVLNPDLGTIEPDYFLLWLLAPDKNAPAPAQAE